MANAVIKKKLLRIKPFRVPRVIQITSGSAEAKSSVDLAKILPRKVALNGFWSPSSFLPQKLALLGLVVSAESSDLNFSHLAESVGVHRHTIKSWMDDPEFHDRYLTERNRRLRLLRLRREKQTEAFTDAVAGLAAKAMVGNDHMTALGYMREFRAFRAEERLDAGEATERVEHQHHVDGEIRTPTSEASFLQYVQNNLILKPDQLRGKTIPEALAELAERAIVETDILQSVEAEDIEATALEVARRPRKR